MKTVGLAVERAINAGSGRIWFWSSWKTTIELKSNHSKTHHCADCHEAISFAVFKYSSDFFKRPLCFLCQQTLKPGAEKATPHEKELFKALRKRKIPAILQKNDGKKTVDIVVVEAKVNIEVDGVHHNTSYEQALKDLKRTYHSFRDGYLTLRIPNTLVVNRLEETAEYISKFLEESLIQLLDEEEEFDDDEYDDDEFEEDEYHEDDYWVAMKFR